MSRIAFPLRNTIPAFAIFVIAVFCSLGLAGIREPCFLIPPNFVQKITHYP
jgi:hypothetical protein